MMSDKSNNSSVDPSAIQDAAVDAASLNPSATEASLGDVSLNIELQRLRAEAEESRQVALRSQAELENFRKRMRREMDDERRYAEQKLLTDLLSVVDNITRAIQAAEKTAGAQSVIDGIRLVQQQLDKVLVQHNCVRIDALNKPLDPMIHQAIMQQPSDTVEAGHITLIAQDGYQLFDRCVRPAQVIVSTGKP